MVTDVRAEHTLKTDKDSFQAMWDGIKEFEVRFNDRNYKVGDILILLEHDSKKNIYSGRVIQRSIKYILKGGQYGIQKDFVVLGLSYSLK